MRWIIGITVVLVFGVLGWFWYPRLMEAKADSPYALLNDSAWLIIELESQDDLQQLTDSTAALAEVDLLRQWPLPELWEGTTSLVLFAFTSSDGEGMGMIAEGGLDWLTDTRFAFRSEHQGYTIASTQAYSIEGPGNGPAAFTPSQVTSPHKLRVHAKADRLLQAYAGHLSASLIMMIMNEGEQNMWIEFDMIDEGNIMQATGIASMRDDQTQRSTDLHLLRFIPANAGIAIVSSTDSLKYGLVHCAYGVNSDPFEYLFILYEGDAINGENTSPDQNYQGIPITISSIPEHFGKLAIPWSDEAYTAHIGAVHIQSASFASLVHLLDDYLADDKLMGSPYFTQIEGAISDAGFTLYVRPDELAEDNPFIHTDIPWPGTNSLVFQAFSELPGQKFFTISMLHHRDIIDEAPVVWSALLDTVVQSGPWPFVNHYTKEQEVLVQDASNKLYLINKDGKTLWKKKLTASIIGDISMVDLFVNGKYQMLFATEDHIHLIDRNGNPVNEFPVKLSGKASVAPTMVRYSSKDDPRIFIGDGNRLINVNEQGIAVKGWNDPALASELAAPIRYFNYSGKDYLMAQTRGGKVHFFDRQGKERTRSIQIDTHQTAIYFQEGGDLKTCRFIGHDTLGNLYDQPIGGSVKVENILPLGSDAGMAAIHLGEHDIVSISDDHFITLNASRDVALDYLFPEPIDPDIQLLDRRKEWIGLNAKDSDHYYILDLDGQMLDKMPVMGKGKGMVLDINGNGNLELIISDGKRELKAYSLAD